MLIIFSFFGNAFCFSLTGIQRTEIKFPKFFRGLILLSAGCTFLFLSVPSCPPFAYNQCQMSHSLGLISFSLSLAFHLAKCQLHTQTSDLTVLALTTVVFITYSLFLPGGKSFHSKEPKSRPRCIRSPVIVTYHSKSSRLCDGCRPD